MPYRLHQYSESGHMHGFSTLHLWRKLKQLEHSELGVIYASSSLRSFGLSLIGVFLPILMLEAGYHFFDVVMWFMTYVFLVHVFVILGVSLAPRFGVKKLMLIGGFIDAIAYALFPVFISYYWCVLCTAILLAVGRGLYFGGFHTEFGHAAKKKSASTQFGILQFTVYFFGVLGPLLGGYFMDVISGDAVMYVGAALYGLSSFILLLRSEYYPQARLSFKRVLELRNTLNPIGYMGFAILFGVSGFFWSLYLYMVVGGKSELGLLYTIVGLLTGLFGIYIGRYLDRHPREHAPFVRLATGFYGLTTLLKAFVFTPLMAFFAAFLGALGFIFLDYPITGDFYRSMKHKDDALNIVVLRELGWIAGRILLIGFILAIYLLYMFLYRIGISVYDIGFGVYAFDFYGYSISMLHVLFVLGSFSVLFFPWVYKKM